MEPKAKSDSVAANEDVKNRGWPKGKKRYPKSPNAPKQPLSAYVLFLNDRRDAVRKECPDISFADISKKLANEWSQLAPDDKQKYQKIAEHDKEVYAKEFEEYQKTDEYKQYLETQKENEKMSKLQKQQAAQSQPKKKAKKSKGEDAPEAPAPEIKEEVKHSGFDFPIFTNEFLEFNRCQESEFKLLRKQVTEMEEQNAVLQKHVESMKSAVGKLESETAQQNENNAALARHLDSLRRLIVASLANVGQTVSLENVDEFVKRIHSLNTEKSPISLEDEALLRVVKDALTGLSVNSIVS